jgi:RNA polymerase sigma-70 factor (ECF subfamily)
MAQEPRSKPVAASDSVDGLVSVSDEWLMQAYLDGNKSAFGVLVSRYERELYGYLRRILGDDALAEDVFQNTFLAVHLKRHLYQAGRPFRPWVYAIASRQAIDTLRRNRRHQLPSLDAAIDNEMGSASLADGLADDEPSPESAAHRREQRTMVQAAVGRLADHLRTVLVLAYYQGMNYQQIADVLGIPIGTVKSRLHAAVGRLGKEWRKLGLTRDS